MVQIISPSPRAMQGERIGQALGLGVAKNFPDPQQLINRRMLQEALNNAKQSVKDPNATPLDKIISFMEAGAGIPGSERYFGTLLPLIQQLSAAEASQKAPFGLEGGVQPNEMAATGAVQGAQQPIPEEIQLNDFLNSNKQNQFFPSNLGGQQAVGNLPQEATSGVKRPVLSNQQLMQMSKPFALQRTEAGLPTTTMQAYEELKSLNNDNIEANKLVDIEREARVKNQEIYGQKAVEQLNKVYSEASPEIQAYFKRLGEEEAGKNTSQAKIEQYLAVEAKNFKNSIANVEKELSRNNLFNQPGRALAGDYKKFEKAAEDLRQHLKPLLDKGFYDTARELLAKKGYGVEEREFIINPLSEREKISLNSVPKAERGNERNNIENIKQGFLNLKKINPNFSLPLARKVFEDKNYDWRIVKDALNELRNEGFQLENDQQIMSGYLDTPPLTLIEKLLHGLNIIGR